MDTGYFIIFGLLGVGFALGLMTKKKDGPDRSGWYGLGAIVSVILCFKFADAGTAELLGFGLMYALPILVLMAIGKEIGSWRRSKKPLDNDEE